MSEKAEKKARFVLPGEHVYDGVLYAGIFPASSLDKVKKFQFKEDDVVVASYPKSGTTWTEEMVWLIMHDGDTEIGKDLPPMLRIPFIESDFSAVMPGIPPDVDRLEHMSSPRIIKQHLTTCFVDKTIEEKKTKFVVVMRNIKDVVVSYYHFYCKLPPLGPFTGTFDDFLELIYDDWHICHGSWFDFNLGWWKFKDYPNVIMMFYEDMIKDTRGEVGRLATFLGKDLDNEILDKITAHVSFDAMSKAHLGVQAPPAMVTAVPSDTAISSASEDKTGTERPPAKMRPGSSQPGSATQAPGIDDITQHGGPPGHMGPEGPLDNLGPGGNSDSMGPGGPPPGAAGKLASIMFRKGKVGDWRNHFSSEQSEYIDTIYNEKMKGSGLHFDFGE